MTAQYMKSHVPMTNKNIFFILQVAKRAHEMLFQLSALRYIFPSPC